MYFFDHLKCALTEIIFREINSLVILVKRWFDGKNVDFSVKFMIALSSSFYHCDVRAIFK